MTQKDEFLVGLYDRLHETPMQRKFRKIAPMPVGVVFIQCPGMTIEDIRSHFRLIKELGFTCLKGIGLCRGTSQAEVMHAALDEGLIPWWYDEGGWEAITDALLASLGLPADTPIDEIRRNKKFLAHQERMMRERIDGLGGKRRRHRREWPTYFSFDMALPEEAVKPFVAWLEETYGTFDALADAWNFHHSMVPHPDAPWRSWGDVERYVRDWIAMMNKKQWGLVPASREYRRLRDILRFKADAYLGHVRARASQAAADDPNAPFRAGGEMALFLPFAARATDMEGIADVMADYGSFYPSIHLAWHFEEVEYEVPRPAYMMAQVVQDWFKGGWAASWESTGGPQQFSGGKAPFWPAAAPLVAGATVDAGVMTQLMLTYLAAGFKGFGFWCWTARTAGWEAGEFALLDRAGRPCERTVRAGQIGQAAHRWRDELWAARKEPTVGVYIDFDNEATWAAMASPGRDHYKHWAVKGRIGASRALIDANIPWEYVTATDLRAGLAGRYKVIYLPTVIAIPSDLLEILSAFVGGGGRLVADMPGAYYDEYGRLLSTAPGTTFEKTFGCTIRDYQYSRNVPRALDGRRLEGFVVDLGVTTADVLSRYDDGQPCVTQNRCGDGAAVLLGYEASLMCWRPGDRDAEEKLVRYALGPYEPPYRCREAIVYRLAAPSADHYFLINDGPAASAVLETPAYAYRKVIDVVTQEVLARGAAIDLEAYGGRWLRFEK